MNVSHAQPISINVVSIHTNDAGIFLIELNSDGTYSWVCYQRHYDANADQLSTHCYTWADATSATYSTIAECIHSCDQYWG